jgi:hypothetical protein
MVATPIVAPLTARAGNWCRRLAVATPPLPSKLGQHLAVDPADAYQPHGLRGAANISRHRRGVNIQPGEYQPDLFGAETGVAGTASGA